MSSIEEVKEKLDIVEVVGRHVPLTKAGRNFKAVCPFHTEKTPSFFVFPERQSWHCFGACGTGGDVFSFVMKQEGLEFGEALRLLADQAGVTLPSRHEDGPRKDERDRLHAANEAAARFFHDSLLKSPAGESARRYLQDRGFIAATVAEFQLGYSPSGWEALKMHLTERGFTDREMIDAGLIVETDDGRTRDRFHNRLMFPIHDARGHTTGFGARALDDSMPKYTNSPQTLVFDKSGTVYAVDIAAATIRKEDRAVLVEGYMDAITAHQNGFKNVVAAMGTSVTERQVTILKRLTRNIVLALDADAAGTEAMLRCVDYENILDAEIRVILLPEGKDPDDFIRENADQWPALVDAAAPAIDYAFDRTLAGLDLSKAADKSRASKELLPVISRIGDPVRRDHYLSKLANSAGIRYNVLEAALRGQTSPQASRQSSRKAASTPQAPLLSSPREEYCLSLLLQHPELKEGDDPNLPEYFQNSQNREIFLRWRQTFDLALLAEGIDPALREQVDSLASRDLLDNQIDKKLADCVLLLREEHLRRLKTKQAEVLAEAGGAGADIARLEEDGIETNTDLKEVFTRRARAMRSVRDES